MSRPVTLLQLRDRARQKANFENATTFITDAELTRLVNTHRTAIYDLLRQAAPPYYYTSSATLSVTPGSGLYALPADFLSLENVYVTSGGRNYEILPLRSGERSYWQAPSASSTVAVEYTPVPTDLAADGDTFDGVNGWDELIVAMCARDMLIKSRESVEQVQLEIQELTARIRTMSHRDRGKPRYIRDSDSTDTRGRYGANPSPSQLGAYRLRGSNIEFYEPVTVWL